MMRVIRVKHILGASKVSANQYCNSRTSVLGRLRDYLRLLMKSAVAFRYNNWRYESET